jgi:hypothetical protein
MNAELAALRESIDEAGRGLAELEKSGSPLASDATLKVLRAQLGALKSAYAALQELDARVIGFPEVVP